MSHNLTAVKQMSAPSIRRRLREAGYSMSDVARRRGCYPSAVSRTIRKQSASLRIWAEVTWCLNHPRRNGS